MEAQSRVTEEGFHCLIYGLTIPSTLRMCLVLHLDWAYCNSHLPWSNNCYNCRQLKSHSPRAGSFGLNVLAKGQALSPRGWCCLISCDTSPKFTELHPNTSSRDEVGKWWTLNQFTNLALSSAQQVNSLSTLDSLNLCGFPFALCAAPLLLSLELPLCGSSTSCFPSR